MGQAKQRGTFEQRKAAAIAGGNVFFKMKQAARDGRVQRKNLIQAMIDAMLRKTKRGAP